MKKELRNINRTLIGIVLALTMPLSGIASVAADETETTGSTEETTAATSEVTTPSATSEETLPSEDLTGKTFENIYGSQLYTFLNHKYVFEGEEIPLVMSNFYFVNSYLDLCQYATAGYYPLNSEGYYDLAAQFDGENPSEFKDYGELYVSYAEKTLENTLIINKRAKDEGVVISLENSNKIDETVNGIDEKAKAAKVTPEEYLKIYFGPDCTKENFKTVLETFYIADQYTHHYCDNYQYTDEEKYAPEIRYALFFAPDDKSVTDEDRKEAEKNANELKSKADSLDKLKTLGQEAVTAGTCAESNDIHVTKGKTVQGFEDWSLDPARKEGDIDVIHTTEYGYFVVGYLGVTEQDKETLDDIAMTKLSTEINNDIESGKYKFETKDAYAPAITTVPTPTVTAQTQESGVLTLPSADIPADDTAPEDGSWKWTPTNTIVVILAGVGGVALTAAIVILVVQFIRNGSQKKDNGSSEEKKEPKKDKKKEKKEEADKIEEADIEQEEIPEEE